MARRLSAPGSSSRRRPPISKAAPCSLPRAAAAAEGQQGLPAHRYGQMEQRRRQGLPHQRRAAASPRSLRPCSPISTCRTAWPVARTARSMSTNRAASSASIPWPPIPSHDRNRDRRRARHTEALQFPSPVQLHVRHQQRHAGFGGRAIATSAWSVCRPARTASRTATRSATSRKATTWRPASGATISGRRQMVAQLHRDGAAACAIRWPWRVTAPAPCCRRRTAWTSRRPTRRSRNSTCCRQGAHYGWPYCYDMHGTNPVWGRRRRIDCNSSRLYPAGAAVAAAQRAASMLYYDGAMFPQLRGKLILAAWLSRGGLSVQDPRERPMEKQDAADESHRKFRDEQVRLPLVPEAVGFLPRAGRAPVHEQAAEDVPGQLPVVRAHARVA